MKVPWRILGFYVVFFCGGEGNLLTLQSQNPGV